MVPTIIALLANIAEINVDCPTLQGLAQQYACIPPQLQMPAMLYLLTLVVNSTAAAGTIQVFLRYWTSNCTSRHYCHTSRLKCYLLRQRYARPAKRMAMVKPGMERVYRILMRARIIILIFLGLCIRSFAGLEYNSVTTNKVVAAGPNIVFTFGNGGTLTISSPNQLPENAPGALTNDGFGNIGWQVGGSGGGGGPIAVNLGQLFTNALGQLSIISGATTTNNFLYEHSPGAIHLTNDNTAISLIIYYDTSFNQDVNQLFSFYSPLQTNAWQMLAGSNVWSMNFVSLNGPDTVTNIIAITNGATPSITSFVPFDVTTENVSGSLTGIGTIQNMVLLNDTNTGVQIYTNSIYTNIFGPTGITNIWGGTTSVYTSGTQQTTNATGNSTFTPTTFAFTNGSSTLIWNGTSLIINGVSINANGAAFNSNSTLSISNAYASNLFASIGIFGAIQETNGWTNFLTSLQMTDGNGNYGGVGAGYSNWPISFGTNTYGIFTTNIGLCISNVQGLAANSANRVRVLISYTNFTSGNATEYISFAGTDIYPNLSGMGNGFQIQQKVGITTPTYMLEGYIWGTNWQGPLAVCGGSANREEMFNTTMPGHRCLPSV